MLWFENKLVVCCGHKLRDARQNVMLCNMAHASDLNFFLQFWRCEKTFVRVRHILAVLFCFFNLTSYYSTYVWIKHTAGIFGHKLTNQNKAYFDVISCIIWNYLLVVKWYFSHAIIASSCSLMLV